MTNLIPSRGAVAQPIFLEIVRELTGADLIELVNAPASAPPAIQTITARHHRMASLLSRGHEVAAVAAIVGTTPQRVSDLKNHDPAFQQLLVYYSDQAVSILLEDTARIQDKLVDTAEMALDEIRTRIEDETTRRNMPTAELRQIAAMGLDRTVAPPKATNAATLPPTQITLNIGQIGPGEKSLKEIASDDLASGNLIESTGVDITKPNE